VTGKFVDWYYVSPPFAGEFYFSKLQKKGSKDAKLISIALRVAHEA